MTQHSTTLLTGISIVTLCTMLQAQANKGAEYSPEHHQHSHHTPVYADSHQSSWTIGASALYMEPSNSTDNYYATLANTNSSGGTTYSDQVIESEFAWGFDVFARYHFAKTDRDITLSYMRLYTTEEDSAAYDTATHPDTGFDYTAKGVVSNNLDMADLMVGQNLHVGKPLKLHLAAGLGYARVQQDFDRYYDQGLAATSLPPSDLTERSNFDYSQFNGLGPKIGVNADYTIHHSDFGLVGGFSAALLVGTLDQSYLTETVTRTSPVVMIDKTPTTSTMEIVPNFNANLGVRYRSHNAVPVGVELGYRVNDFLKAVWGYDDFSIQGVYLTFDASFH